ncbi:diacylglycerol kinase family protein [Virgibacillus sp. C22-A2]|uniref:Diacylglycerol kinase family protein n=1 Tax=Virgibacillus tibetensis TaxID=3042313 RepID=A0ABU6KCH6_9BACI|nr:diacylglycerol kinase family protein [Virgibacillus sp. C22-A2]
MKGNKRSIGFTHAWNGIKEVARTERNFRIHLLATLLVFAAGIVFKLTVTEWLIIVLAVGLVLVAEITNTAIEKMMDYLKPGLHPSAKVIKDIAAGAVLVAAVTSLILGILIFLPKLYSIF